MENGDALYARIAELEKENEYHRNRTDALYNVWYEGGNCGDELKDCLLLLYNKDFLQNTLNAYLMTMSLARTRTVR